MINEVIDIELSQFFAENRRAALGFSGGVDSSYLLYAGRRYGAELHAYFVKSPFQPEFELRDAYRAAEQVGVEFTVIELDNLRPDVASNPADRCYHCKKMIFGALKERALADGVTLLLDGTNASDDEGDRPGMRAVKELSVRSPLRECGITKDEVRRLSKEAGLFTWDKPAYACLATRIPTGREITRELLSRVERAEDGLFALGFTDFRVRVLGEAAKIQLPPDQMEKALRKRAELIQAVKPYFASVLLDMEGR